MSKHLLLPAEYVGDRAHYFAENHDGFAIASVQDVAPILEEVQAQRMHNDGYSQDRSVRRVAHVPASVRDLWLQQEGWDAYRPDLYAEKLAEKFNDPDWYHLRTADGQMSARSGILR